MVNYFKFKIRCKIFIELEVVLLSYGNYVFKLFLEIGKKRVFLNLSNIYCNCMLNKCEVKDIIKFYLLLIVKFEKKMLKSMLLF